MLSNSIALVSMFFSTILRARWKTFQSQFGISIYTSPGNELYFIVYFILIVGKNKRSLTPALFICSFLQYSLPCNLVEPWSPINSKLVVSFVEKF